MKELLRQRYLKAFGLTPWVARVPLPGAAPSPQLEWEQESDGVPRRVAEGTPLSALPRTSVSSPSSRQADGATSAASVEGAGAEPEAAPAAPTGPKTEPAMGATPAAGPASRFTLEAHLAGDVWVVFQQEDPQAPGLGRHTGALAASLLAVFGGTPSPPCRFYCPLTEEQPLGSEQASQALTAFFNGLTKRMGGARVLLCLQPDLAAALFADEARYQPRELGGQPALVISSLSEMLDDPASHKGRSWQAMCEHRFDGQGA